MRKYTVAGHTVKVGQNAQENWMLLEKAKEGYYFFHLRNFPSCYVVWECEDEKVADEVLEEISRICVANTKHKKAKGIKVDCTRCGNVFKGDRVGECMYTHRRKVRVIKI